MRRGGSPQLEDVIRMNTGVHRNKTKYFNCAIYFSFPNRKRCLPESYKYTRDELTLNWVPTVRQPFFAWFVFLLAKCSTLNRQKKERLRALFICQNCQNCQNWSELVLRIFQNSACHFKEWLFLNWDSAAPSLQNDTQFWQMESTRS